MGQCLWIHTPDPKPHQHHPFPPPPAPSGLNLNNNITLCNPYLWNHRPQRKPTEENNRGMLTKTITILTKISLSLTGGAWLDPSFPGRETQTPHNTCSLRSPHLRLLQGSCCLLSSDLSDAVSRELLLLLHLPQIYPQNLLLGLLGLSLAFIPTTFLLITTSTALTEWVKFPSTLPQRGPYFRGWVCLFCPQDFAKHHYPGFTQRLFCWRGILHNIASEQGTHLTATAGLIEQWNDL